MLGALTTSCHHLRYARRIAFRNAKKISLSENKTLEPEQIQVLELRLTGCDILTILPTGYGKSWIYQFFLAKVFASNPNTSMSVIAWLINTGSTSSPENNSENMNWRGLAFLPFIDFHLKTLRCYRQTCHYSWMISSVEYIMSRPYTEKSFDHERANSWA